MSTVSYTGLIPENVAPENATGIAVYKGGKEICKISDMGVLARPPLGAKLYTFGALSDVHISYDTAKDDFQTALTFLRQTAGAAFTCICGDLTVQNEDTEWEDYASYVSQYAGSMPVYPVSGNHDCYGSGLTDARMKQYTGHGTFYTFTQGDDVFIMLSQIAWPSVSNNIQPFATTGLQQLYNALETNRNKRCFVFQHNFPWGHSGDPFKLYSANALYGTQGEVIYSLMRHYKNAIWFHGHSHQKFEVQEQTKKATYDFDFGVHSVHIPSIAVPVDVIGGTRVVQYAGSQGYVVDVYANHIMLSGRDFVAGEFLPIACYLLDTTLQTVEAGTYVDSTGTVTT